MMGLVWSRLDGEAAGVRNQRKDLRPQSRVGRARAGLEVEAISVQGANHVPAIESPAGQGAAFVRAPVLDRVDAVLTAEDGDPDAVPRQEPTRAFGAPAAGVGESERSWRRTFSGSMWRISPSRTCGRASHGTFSSSLMPCVACEPEDPPTKTSTASTALPSTFALVPSRPMSATV